MTDPAPTDALTNAPDTDYFLLGDGSVTLTIQWSRTQGLSPYGVLISDPERMPRKNGTFLFHPELGLERTMLTVIVDGQRFRPRHEDVTVAWDLGRRCVVVRWKAGDIVVIERFLVQSASGNIVRDVLIESTTTRQVALELPFYPNPLLFDRFGVHPGATLHADGYASLMLYSLPAGRAFERFLQVDARPAGSGISATFIYALDLAQEKTPTAVDDLRPARDIPPEGEPTLARRLEELFTISRFGLRGAVSRNGRFDASIWQYGMEWGMDAGMVATAASMSGMFTLARSVLLRLLRVLTNEEGTLAEAGRFRGGAMSELNANGAMLDALWHYWRWSGDGSLINTHWGTIVAIAEYPLRPEYQHSSGMLQSGRDFWERMPWMGVRPGLELGHQVFCSTGLSRAAEIAAAAGHAEAAERWRNAAERIRAAMLHDPGFSLLDDGAFVRRRLLDGAIERELVPRLAGVDPIYAPYVPGHVETPSTPRLCEPDVTEALPVIYRLVDPAGAIARKTLENLRALWSPTGAGGYARYNIASDPDSPGAWPFATAMVAAAELEAGNHERALETVAWLAESAGAGGSWFEYYGERRAGHFPPVGLIVWGWAQYMILYTRHLLGIRIEADALTIAPRISDVEHVILHGSHSIRLSIHGLTSATIDGVPVEIIDEKIRIALPLQSNHVVVFR